MVGANACAALKHTLLVVQQIKAARILKILACSWNLACTFRGCFYMVLEVPFLMELGFQWTKYCSWDVGICQSPRAASNGGGWIRRSGGRGQMGETTGSTSAATPAISRSTFSRQHHPEDLTSKLQRDIHLINLARSSTPVRTLLDLRIS
jgi:hypothetical protein